MSQVSEAERRFATNRERFEANKAKVDAGARLLVGSREWISARIGRAVRLVNSPDEPAANNVALEGILGRTDLLNIIFLKSASSEPGVSDASSSGRDPWSRGSGQDS
jgi:hypothetical protein